MVHFSAHLVFLVGKLIEAHDEESRALALDDLDHYLTPAYDAHDWRIARASRWQAQVDFMLGDRLAKGLTHYLLALPPALSDAAVDEVTRAYLTTFRLCWVVERSHPAWQLRRRVMRRRG